MSTDLVLSNQSVNLFENDKKYADAFMQSGLFTDIRSASQAIVKITAGRELGLEPFASMSAIEIIKGRVFLKPMLYAALINKSSTYKYQVLESDSTQCRIAFRRGDAVIGVSQYTLDDAKKQGLIGKDNYKTVPEEMLFYRAMGRGVRKYCPDIFLAPVFLKGIDDVNEFDDDITTAKNEFAESVAVSVTKNIPKIEETQWEGSQTDEVLTKHIVDTTEDAKRGQAETPEVKKTASKKPVKTVVEKPVETSKMARPYPPEYLKTKIVEKATAKGNDNPIEIENANVIYETLCGMTDEDLVDLIIHYLLDTSLEEMTQGQAETLLAWLGSGDAEGAQVLSEVDSIVEWIGINEGLIDEKPMQTSEDLFNSLGI